MPISLDGTLGINSSGNVTAPYFHGNGAFLTGISGGGNGNSISSGNSNISFDGNGNAVVNVNSNAVATFAPNQTTITGNLNPSADVLYSLGNSTNQWKDLWVSNNTIFINQLPLSVVEVANVATIEFNGAPIVTSSNTAPPQTANISTTAAVVANEIVANSFVYSNGAPFIGYTNSDVANYLASGNVTTEITTTANVTANFFIGDGSQLTGLPATYGNANVEAYLPNSNTIIAINSNVANTNNNVSNLTTTVSGLGTDIATLNAALANTNSNVANTNSNVANVASNVATLQGQVYTDSNVAAYLPTYTGNIGATNITVANTVTAATFIGNFQGNISGNLVVPGANTWVLYNNDGNAGADIGFRYDVSTKDVVVGNTVTANFFVGDGSQLTGLPAAYGNANVADYLPTYSGNIANLTVTGNLTATTQGNSDNSNLVATTSFVQNVVAAAGGYGNAQVEAYLPTSPTITGIESNVSNVTANVANLTTALANTDSNVANLTTALSNTNSNVANLTSALANTNSNVANLVTITTNTNSNVANLTTALANTDSNVANLTSGLANTNSNVANLVTITTNTNSNVANLTTALANTDSNVANLQSQVNAIPTINTIPAVYLSAVANGNGQVFSNVILGSYTSNASMTVFLNGALLENTFYTLSGDTLTINTYLQTGDNIDVITTLAANVNNVSSGYGNSNVALFFNNYAGNIVPATNNAYTLGTTGNRWATVNSNTLNATGNVNSGGLYVNGAAIITGNMQVQGNLTYNNITNLTTSNLVLGLGNTQTGANVSGGGIVVGNTAEAAFLYNYSTQAWVSNIGITSNANITASYFTGTLTTNAQPNVTSVGTLTALTATGNIDIDGSGELNILTNNNHGGANYAGIMTMTNTNGGATNPNKFLRLNNVGNLEIVNSAYSQVIFSLSDSGNINTSGNISAPYFLGDGSQLTNLPAPANTARAYTFSINSDRNLSTILSNAGVTDRDGAVYTIVNTAAVPTVLTLPSILNRNNYGAGLVTTATTLLLAVNTSITIQTFVADTSYYIMSYSGSSLIGGSAKVTSMGAPPANTDTIINWDPNIDPNGWWNATNHRFTPTIGGWYFCSLNIAVTSSSNQTQNVQIRKNDVSFALQKYQVENAFTNMVNLTTMVYLNGAGDYINATIYPGTSTNTGVQTGNESNFSIYMIK